MTMAGDVRTLIGVVNTRFLNAFRSGDAPAMANCYTAGAQLLPANSDFVQGTAAIRMFWQGAVDMGLKDASLETIEVEEHGDTAIEVGRYRLLAAAGAVADRKSVV